MRSITITYLQFQLYSIVIATCHKKQQWSSHVLGLYWFWHFWKFGDGLYYWYYRHWSFDVWSKHVRFGMVRSIYICPTFARQHLIDLEPFDWLTFFTFFSLSLSFLFKTLRSNSTNLIRQKLKKKLYFRSNCNICLAKDVFSFQKGR